MKRLFILIAIVLIPLNIKFYSDSVADTGPENEVVISESLSNTGAAGNVKYVVNQRKVNSAFIEEDIFIKGFIFLEAVIFIVMFVRIRREHRDYDAENKNRLKENIKKLRTEDIKVGGLNELNSVRKRILHEEKLVNDEEIMAKTAKKLDIATGELELANRIRTLAQS